MKFQDLIDKRVLNIWRYNGLYREPVRLRFRLSLNEGWTKEENFQELDKKSYLPNFYLKREDLNPLGSFKIRGLAYQISRAWQNGEKEFSISSTGNAALAAAAICHKAHLKLFIFFHPRPKSKEKRKRILKKIKSFKPQEIFFEREPTKKCQDFSKLKKIYNLTPSYDSYSSEGFKSIGFEIFEKILESKKIEDLAIFSFSSSGSSLVGIGESFRFLVANKFLKKLPRFYPVKINNIKRLKEIRDLVKESEGKILDISEKEIKKTQDFLSRFKIRTSEEGTAAFGGFLKVNEKERLKNAIIILSGRKWDD